MTSLLSTSLSRRAVSQLRTASTRATVRCPMEPRLSVAPSTTNTILSSRATATFSSESSPSSSGIRGWMEGRKEKKEQEKYMEQMGRLSNMDELTLENYKKELENGLDSMWGMANISFMQTKEVKLAKEVVDVVSCFIDVLGNDAKADDLINMDRMQRLQVATASNKTLEEVGILVSQILNMDLMQRTLKKRRIEGKPIPPDAQTMQAAIKKDALSVMTKSQKDMMKTRQQGMAKRMARRRK